MGLTPNYLHPSDPDFRLPSRSFSDFDVTLTLIARREDMTMQKILRTIGLTVPVQRDT